MMRGEIAIAGGSTLIPDAYKTSNALERARGLLGRKKLYRDQALVIEPCASIHTFGMTYALDVAFLDDAGLVVKVKHALKPFRFAAAPGARTTVEMIAGALEPFGIRAGVRLEWRRA